jgi:predicted DNA-binding protein
MKRLRGKMLHIMVTEEIAAKLKLIAKKQGRTVTELAREAFAKVIKEYECSKKKEK